MKPHGLDRSLLKGAWILLAGLACLSPARPARAAEPDSTRADSLHIKVWETQLHSSPEQAHRGQPFDLHVHVIWGSRTGDEAVLPLWRPQAGLSLLETSYSSRSTRDQPGGGYAVHAKLEYKLVASREGVLPIDSLRVAIVRGGARREIRFARTAIMVLPPVSLWPRPWNAMVFGAGLAVLAIGLVVLRARRPRRKAQPEPTPEERFVARLAGLETSEPSKATLESLLALVRQESVRRHGGTWTRAGAAAFEGWARGATAPEGVKERTGALSANLESRLYVPENPEPTMWHHWIEETRRLWRVDDERTRQERPNEGAN